MLYSLHANGVTHTLACVITESPNDEVFASQIVLVGVHLVGYYIQIVARDQGPIARSWKSIQYHVKQSFLNC